MSPIDILVIAITAAAAIVAVAALIRALRNRK